MDIRNYLLGVSVTLLGGCIFVLMNVYGGLDKMNFVFLIMGIIAIFIGIGIIIHATISDGLARRNVKSKLSEIWKKHILRINELKDNLSEIKKKHTIEVDGLNRELMELKKSINNPPQKFRMRGEEEFPGTNYG